MKKDNFYKSYTIGIIVWIIVAILFCHVVDKFTVSDEEQDIVDIKTYIESMSWAISTLQETLDNGLTITCE